VALFKYSWKKRKPTLAPDMLRWHIQQAALSISRTFLDQVAFVQIILRSHLDDDSSKSKSKDHPVGYEATDLPETFELKVDICLT
jgi:hypothetical protein